MFGEQQVPQLSMRPIDKLLYGYSRDHKGCIINNYVRQIGYLFFTDSNSQAGRIYDANGLSPTIVCNGVGHKQPKVIVVNETD